MVALADFDGLHELIPPFIGIDGVRITVFLQHFPERLLDLGFPEPWRIASLVAVVHVGAVKNIVVFS